MPVKTTTLAQEPVLVEQHELTVCLDPVIEHASSTTSRVLSATILTYGATLTHLRCPDRWNQVQDVVLGFDNWQDYLAQAEPGALNPYFGAIVGRTASRIGNASFVLESRYNPTSSLEVEDDKRARPVSASKPPPHIPGNAKTQIQTQTYMDDTQAQIHQTSEGYHKERYESWHTLEISNGVDCHHGGPLGFDKLHWTTIDVQQEDTSVTLQLISPHGQNGYPGRLVTKVKYRLTSLGELSIEYWAYLEEVKTDRDRGDSIGTQNVMDLHSTIVSLTNHTYWNLDGVLNPVTGGNHEGRTLQEIMESGNDGGMSVRTESKKEEKEQDDTIIIKNHLSIRDHTLWLNTSKLIELGTSHPVPTGRILDLSSSNEATVSNEHKALLNLTSRVHGTTGTETGQKCLGPGLDRIPGGYGYDHVYALDNPVTPHLSSPLSNTGIQGFFPHCQKAAILFSPRTGIRLDLSTSEPALVLYAAGYLDHKLLSGTKSIYLDASSSQSSDHRKTHGAAE
ncbi:hypothetical protein BGX28_006467, partial [Mortierella sp. GBA30]